MEEELNFLSKEANLLEDEIIYFEQEIKESYSQSLVEMREEAIQKRKIIISILNYITEKELNK